MDVTEREMAWPAPTMDSRPSTMITRFRAYGQALCRGSSSTRLTSLPYLYDTVSYNQCTDSSM